MTSRAVLMSSGGIFDYAGKRDRLEEVNRELENPKIWDKPEQAQSLGRERSHLHAGGFDPGRVDPWACRRQ